MESALDESGGDTEYASLAEMHQFEISKDCHWNDVRENKIIEGNLPSAEEVLAACKQKILKEFI